MVLIWTLSSFPMVASVEEVAFKDKAIHFAEYGVLAMLLCHAVRGSLTQPGLGFALFYGCVGTVFWGLLDETLVIWGDRDRTYPWSQIEGLWRGISGSGLAVVPGCAHAVHLEKPALFNALLRDFLAAA